MRPRYLRSNKQNVKIFFKINILCYNKDVMRRKIASFFIFIFFILTIWVWSFWFFPSPAQAEGKPSDFDLPNDPYYYHQWYLEKIKTDKAWENIEESPEVVVAVIDTGVQVTHPDLEGNIWLNKDEIPDNNIDDDNNGFIDDVNGWDFITNSPDPSPRFEEGFTEAGVSHGTIVSGIIAANINNKKGVAGISRGAKIMPLRVLDDKGGGGGSEVIRAIDYAIKNKADIINLSFVGSARSEGMQEAIRRAYEANVIVVAAAGNEQSGGKGYNLDKSPMYPVCYDKNKREQMVIGVGATDTLDQKTTFSSYGECVDIMAPGISIFNTVAYAPDQELNGKVFDKYYNGFWSGTSMATPMVSGTLALIEAANPEIRNEQIKGILFDNVDNIDKLNPEYIGKIGSGRLSAGKSVVAAKDLLESKEVKMLMAPNSERESTVRMINYDNELEKEFLTFSSFRGGVNLASGDIDGDGKEEIITGAGPGGGPHVRIFDSQANLVGQFFAYNSGFRGGVKVACANINGNISRNKDEIIISPQSQGSPQIRVFNNYAQPLIQFFAYSKSFRGGVNLASGDIDG